MCADVRQLVNNHTAELAAAAHFMWIRLAAVASDSASHPLLDIKSLTLSWQRASASALGGASWSYFSATCWLTARDVAMALGPSVPLGLVETDVGGTPIEAWTPGATGTDPQGHKGAVLYNAMVAPLTGLANLWYQGEDNSFKLQAGGWNNQMARVCQTIPRKELAFRRRR